MTASLRSAACHASYAAVRITQLLILELQLFEPAFYTTMDVPDWVTSVLALPSAGEAGQGPAVYHSGITAGHQHRISSWRCCLLRAGKPGRRSISLRSTRDDDLMVARPTVSICSASCTRCASAVASSRVPRSAFMLDQCPTSIRRSWADPVGLNVQEATAKAMLVYAASRPPRSRPATCLAPNAVL